MKSKEESGIKPQPCMTCGKVIHAPYGRWIEGWTCSAKCNTSFSNERERYTHPTRR